MVCIFKIKTNRDITWDEKGELKYKDKTVQGSNVVDLVNDVLRKRKYFNPQGWEIFGAAIREANVSSSSCFMQSACILCL
jgi:hypothetical protein